MVRKLRWKNLFGVNLFNGLSGHMLKRLREERGSIMLEAVIALPIYMTLIGGIQWMGEVTLVRQKAHIAERYIAWNQGNRHNTSAQVSPSELQSSALFQGVMDLNLTIPEQSKTQHGEYKQYAKGKVEMDLAPIAVVQGFFNSSAFVDRNATPLSSFRVNVFGAADGHSVLSRSGEESDVRYELGDVNFEVEIDWKDVMDDPWWP
jgi:hypothetical protein